MLDAVKKLPDTLKKIKYNGFRWSLGMIFKHILSGVFRYQDNSLMLYTGKLDETPLIAPRRDDLEFSWLSLADKEMILALKDWEMDSDTIETYFSNGSICQGAFLGERLIGYAWAHFGEFPFPNYKYTVPLTEKELFAGPTFIDPEFRGPMLSAALLSRVLAFLRQRDYDAVYGTALKDNLTSHKSIANLGVKVIREIRAVRLGRYLIFNKVYNR